ncbi:MAG: hypothetical protein RBU30_04010 [Polyangia bacterium]|jgi:hypothetical protein|nr:hypothetical protein [Polyangia bacterium]
MPSRNPFASRLWPWLLALLFGVGSLFLAARPSNAACSAQNKTKITRLVKGAMDDFDLLEIQSALRKLQRAIELAEDQDCETSMEYADALLKKGVVHWRGEQDIGRCKVHMTKALKANPCVQLDRNMPPQVTRIWQEVKDANPGLKCAGGGAKEPDDRPPPRRDDPRPDPDARPRPRVVDFGEPPTKPCEHKAIDEVEGGSAIQVLVKVAGDLGADKVIVFYKPQGEESYKKLTLKKEENGWAWTGLIPSIDVHGQRLAYFIEVQNSGGTAICAPLRATSSQPEIIMVKAGSSSTPAGCTAELPEEVCQTNPDHPCCKKTGRPGRKKPPKIKDPKAYPPFYLHAGFALGVGYLSQSMRSFKNLQAHVAGFALGPIGAQLEFGYILAAKHLLSVNARFGISFSDMSETSVISWMATLRYRYFILGGGKSDLFTLYAGAEVGGAMIFHSLAVGNDGEKDTFEHGYVVVGALVGILIGTQTVGWFLEIDPLGIFPNQSTFHLGVSTGVALRF